MPLKLNPLRLNALQLKTLTLFQALAEEEDRSAPHPDSGGRMILSLPHAHGDHFHLGSHVVLGKDATGLSNQGVWKALERKGLISGAFPNTLAVTPEGLSYDTGLKSRILHGSDH